MNTYIIITKPSGISHKAYIMIGASPAKILVSGIDGKMPYEIYKGTDTMLLNGFNSETLREDIKRPMVHAVKQSQLHKIEFMELLEDVHVEDTAEQYNAHHERTSEAFNKETQNDNA